MKRESGTPTLDLCVKCPIIEVISSGMSIENFLNKRRNRDIREN